MRSGRSAPAKLYERGFGVKAMSSSKPGARSRNASNIGYDQKRKTSGAWPSLCRTGCTTRSCSGFGYGGSRSSAVSTTEKMVVLAPRPTARVTAATVVNPGLLRRRRSV